MNIIIWNKIEHTKTEYRDIVEAKILETVIMIKFSDGRVLPFDRTTYMLLDHGEDEL